MTVLDSDKTLDVLPQPEPVVTDPDAVSRVTVNPPFQVSHDGIVYRRNEVVEVPEDVAALWIRDGWVTDGG